jgi:hypothetical protein
LKNNNLEGGGAKLKKIKINLKLSPSPKAWDRSSPVHFNVTSKHFFQTKNQKYSQNTLTNMPDRPISILLLGKDGRVEGATHFGHHSST